MKSKKIPTYLKYYLSKTRLSGLVFNKTYLENLSGTSFYLDHSIEDKIKINLKASESTQDSEPTPESPQDIHVVKGDNEVVIENENLFKIDNYVKIGWIITIDNPLKNMEVGTYTISCQNKYITENAGIRIYFSNEVNGDRIGNLYTDYQFGSSVMVSTQNLIQEQLNANYMILYPNDNKGTEQVLENMKIMIQKGNQATPYVEHQEQNYPLTLGNLEMCNINNNADEFFKNVPECEYYDNTLEEGKWYKYGRIGKVVLDGSETYVNKNITDNNLLFQTTINTSINNSNIKSNYFTENTNLWSTDTEGMGFYDKVLRMRIKSSLLADITTSENAINSFKNWLSTHNTIVYYILATPAKTLLSDTLQEELDNIKNNAHTYNQITNIQEVNEDRPFILDISYYRKVK